MPPSQNSARRISRRGRWSGAELARLRELYGLRDEAAIARELNRPVASVARTARRLFPPAGKRGPWSASEVLQLKRYLGATSPEVIARILGRSVEQVSQQIHELGRIQRNDAWERDELARFKRIYGTRTDEDLSLIFARSVEAIRQLAAEHRLSKDKAFVRRLAGIAATRMPRWAPEEVETLKQCYPTESNLEISRRLDRSVKSIVSKAHHLGLEKSAERLREMGRDNVSLRYKQT